MESTFTIKSKVYAGKQSIQLLRNLKGSKACIVTDSIMEQLGYLQQAKQLLNEAGMEVAIFKDVRPDPDTSVVAAGLKVFNASGADVLVALGGGSAIDAAKAILYAAWQEAKADFNRPDFIAIPSTSGTGSEVTNFAVITAEEGKVCIVDEFIAPDIAILDSTCIKHVPNKVIADTGVDVLVHAIEAYVSNKATDFTDALAEKAVQLTFRHLETLYRNPSDSNARDRIQNASCMAGMAFTNSNLGINHSLAHAFGGRFHIPHGRANAMFLLPVMEYNANLTEAANRERERYAHLATLLGLPARTVREGTISLMDGIGGLFKALNIETSIKALGIDANDYNAALDIMSEAALNDRCTPSSPRQPAKEDLIAIYKRTYKSAR